MLQHKPSSTQTHTYHEEYEHTYPVGKKVALREYIEGGLGEDSRHIGTLRNSHKQSNMQTRTLTSRLEKVVG